MNLRSETWRRGPAAVATAATGLVTIGGQLSEIAITGREVRSSLPLLPLHVLGILGGLGLLVLAAGLWHGKRRAAQVGIVALALIGTANLAFGVSVTAAAIDLGAAGFILVNLDAFRRGLECGAPRGLTGAAGLAVGAGLYALYAVLATGATQGTDVDGVIATVSGSQDRRPLRDRAREGRDSRSRSRTGLARSVRPQRGQGALLRGRFVARLPGYP